MTPDDFLQGTPLVVTYYGHWLVHSSALQSAVALSLEQGGCEVHLKPLQERTAAQNRRMWAMLSDVSQQVNWYGTRLTPDEWKDVFTASLKRQKVVPGLDGGFVVVGGRTSRMSKSLFSDLITLMLAFGADPLHIVCWSDPKYAEEP